MEAIGLIALAVVSVYAALALLPFWKPMCPTGLGHRVKGDLATNINGNRFCWHPRCMQANRIDCKRHVCEFKAQTVYGHTQLVCRCGEVRLAPAECPEAQDAFPFAPLAPDAPPDYSMVPECCDACGRAVPPQQMSPCGGDRWECGECIRLPGDTVLTQDEGDDK